MSQQANVWQAFHHKQIQEIMEEKDGYTAYWGLL